MTQVKPKPELVHTLAWFQKLMRARLEWLVHAEHLGQITQDERVAELHHMANAEAAIKVLVERGH